MTRARGFTLVELMISVGLFGLIASGAMSLVMSAVRAQSHSTRVDVAQSGLRAGLDFITRDLLSASAGARSGTIRQGWNGVDVPSIAILTANNSATLPDALDLYLVDATVWATVTAPVIAASTSITVNSSVGFAINDVVQISDLTTAMLVRVTGIPGATTINIANPNTFPPSVTTFAAGSWLFKSRHVRYAVDLTNVSATANEGMLTMDLFDGANWTSNAQPLAEGVEDLQVAYGFDDTTPPDGVIFGPDPGANNDEWIFNAAGDALPASLANLRAVRITLVTRSTLAEPGTFTARPKAEDHAAGTADGFFRRVIRSEVTVRNFNL